MKNLDICCIASLNGGNFQIFHVLAKNVEPPISWETCMKVVNDLKEAQQSAHEQWQKEYNKVERRADRHYQCCAGKDLPLSTVLDNSVEKWLELNPEPVRIPDQANVMAWSEIIDKVED